jgi:hypothetical protein
MRRLVPSILLALACALIFGSAAPAAGALTRAGHTRQAISLLKVYIDDYAAEHSFVYPAAGVVKKDGGLTAPVWPVNPWTGKPMAPGTTPGCFTYTVYPNGTYYELVGHIARTSFVVSGSAPTWLIDERTTSAADLSTAQAAATAAQAAATKAAADLTPSQDAATKNGLAMIQEAARNLAQGTGAPPTTQLLTYENLHASWPGWPVSAFDGQPMHQGTQPGDFTYTPSPDGSWTFVAHLTSGDYTLTQGAYDWAAARNAQTKVGATLVGYGIELQAIQYNDTYPATVSRDVLQNVVDPWPANPFTGQPMSDSMTRGNYHYSTTMSGYTLVANLADGSTYDVAAWTKWLFSPLWRLRVSLKDRVAEGYAQVLKDYVDEWKLAHAGALPTLDQMSATGAVGAAHTWWPLNPWTLQPMAQGTSTGYFEYTPGEAGAFTIVLHQNELPMIYGDPSTAYAATYTAQ